MNPDFKPDRLLTDSPQDYRGDDDSNCKYTFAVPESWWRNSIVMAAALGTEDVLMPVKEYLPLLNLNGSGRII